MQATHPKEPGSHWSLDYWCHRYSGSKHPESDGQLIANVKGLEVENHVRHGAALGNAQERACEVKSGAIRDQTLEGADTSPDSKCTWGSERLVQFSCSEVLRELGWEEGEERDGLAVIEVGCVHVQFFELGVPASSLSIE